MTIYSVGDKVRRPGQAVEYEIEEVQGDQYRLITGEGDSKRTSFARGFELEPASNEVEKPEVELESAGGMDLSGPPAPADQVAAEAPTFNQIPPPNFE